MYEKRSLTCFCARQLVEPFQNTFFREWDYIGQLLILCGSFHNPSCFLSFFLRLRVCDCDSVLFFCALFVACWECGDNIYSFCALCSCSWVWWLCRERGRAVWGVGPQLPRGRRSESSSPARPPTQQSGAVHPRDQYACRWHGRSGSCWTAGPVGAHSQGS